MRPPTPIAEFRKPTPARPLPRSFSAITTISTFSMPSTNVCAENRPTSRRSRRSPMIVRAPASSSARMDSGTRRSCGGALTPLRSRTDQSISPASRMNTVPAPETESTTPPIAGPPKIPTLSIVLETTFAAVSSSGVRANAGVSAACAGRNGVAATFTSPARK